MPDVKRVGALAASSTGNNTHASVNVPNEVEAVVLEFEVTVAGATPTVSWLFQASMDDSTVADASSDWFGLTVLPSDSNTELATVQTKTAVGVYASTVELARRPFRKVRLVTSANTNITYEAELYAVDMTVQR